MRSVTFGIVFHRATRPRGTDPAHGATDLETPPSASCGHMSIDSCKQKCMNLDGCTAITISTPDAVSAWVPCSFSR